MKEPDEEKALSESDERKPDFKAEQFSDGASDTPSSEIPPSNEDDGARKNEENDSLLTRAIHKLGNKKRAAIAAAVAVVIIFSLPMLFPQLFCSHKLWANATCTSARVCICCGNTEGDPLGHEWEEATCTTPKTCQRCGKTKGEPLGHQPGSWTKEVDYVDATSKEIRECERCGEVVDTRNEKEITSFLGDGKFSISPEGFIDRLNEEFSNIPNCSSMNADYELDDSGMGLELQIKNGSKIAGIGGFFSDSSNTVQKHSHVLRELRLCRGDSIGNYTSNRSNTFVFRRQGSWCCLRRYANCQKWNYVRNRSFEWRVLAKRSN